MAEGTGEASERTTSYGQTGQLSVLDKLGVALSTRKMRAVLGDFGGKRFADLGCGFNASAAREVAKQAATTTLVDLALAPDLSTLPGVRTIEGHLPECLATLEDDAFDLIVCSAVLEHLEEPDRMLAEVRRLLAPGGACFITVPNWLGKRCLEFSAFRLGLSPAIEMDDHKTYYDPKDLWPMLVRAGFLPHNITCRRYKFGLNTFARCKVPT